MVKRHNDKKDKPENNQIAVQELEESAERSLVIKDRLEKGIALKFSGMKKSFSLKITPDGES